MRHESARAASPWRLADIPDQSGRVAVITGATSGIGLETAVALAGAGADVVLTGRNAAKGAAALAAVRARHPQASARYDMLDLASLDAISAFAERLAAAQPALHLLVNNAGVMALPTRQTTRDGFEAQFGINFLGHVALTARLLPLLRRAPGARIVNVSSLVHQRARLDFTDLQAERAYRPWTAYGQSKLAMLMFALEGQRRSEAGGWGVTSLAAHPGWSRTAILASGPGSAGGPRLMTAAMHALSHVFGQSAAAGALPILYAATAPQAMGGGYYGPDRFGEMTGAPAPARIAPQAQDRAAARRLWEVAGDLVVPST